MKNHLLATIELSTASLVSLIDHNTVYLILTIAIRGAEWYFFKRKKEKEEEK